MRALVSIQRWLGGVGLISRLLDPGDQFIQSIDEEGGMGFARRFEIRFDTEVELYVLRLEPGTAAFCKFIWFGNLRETQQADIERTRLFYFTGRHGDLHVINGEDGHFYLRLDWISCFEPGGKAAQDGSNLCITVIKENERRTGACVLILSGAVGDDPLVLLEVQACQVGLDLA